jgi:addiction module RelE/StbE family toxin
MSIKYSTTFKKQYKKAPRKIQEKVKERISLFVQNPTNQLLNNHALIGKFQGCRSINITGDWRAVYSVRQKPQSKQEYYFELVGTHSQLYK